MLEEGMAWHYEQFDHNKRLRDAKQSARAAAKGLWLYQVSAVGLAGAQKTR